MTQSLEKEINFFSNHLSEWLGQFANKYALIHDQNLIGTFGSDLEALQEGARLFGRESFLVRPIVAQQQLVSVPALILGVLNAPSTPADGRTG